MTDESKNESTKDAEAKEAVRASEADAETSSERTYELRQGKVVSESQLRRERMLAEDVLYNAQHELAALVRAEVGALVNHEVDLLVNAAKDDGIEFSEGFEKTIRVVFENMAARIFDMGERANREGL